MIRYDSDTYNVSIISNQDNWNVILNGVTTTEIYNMN